MNVSCRWESFVGSLKFGSSQSEFVSRFYGFVWFIGFNVGSVLSVTGKEYLLLVYRLLGELKVDAANLWVAADE